MHDLEVGKKYGWFLKFLVMLGGEIKPCSLCYDSWRTTVCLAPHCEILPPLHFPVGFLSLQCDCSSTDRVLILIRIFSSTYLLSCLIWLLHKTTNMTSYSFLSKRLSDSISKRVRWVWCMMSGSSWHVSRFSHQS